MKNYKSTKTLMTKYNVSRPSLKRWHAQKKIKAINIENRWFYDEKDVISLLAPAGYIPLKTLSEEFDGIAYTGVKRLVRELGVKTEYRNKVLYVRKEDTQIIEERVYLALYFKGKQTYNL